MRLPVLPIGDQLALVEAWLMRFPADYWYRERYHLPLFSPQHRATDLRSVRAEFEQHNLLVRLRALPADARSLTPDELAGKPLMHAPGTVVVPMSREEIEQEFEALELDRFSDPVPAESDVILPNSTP